METCAVKVGDRVVLHYWPRMVDGPLTVPVTVIKVHADGDFDVDDGRIEPWTVCRSEIASGIVTLGGESSTTERTES